MQYSITMTVSPLFNPEEIINNLSQKAMTSVEYNALVPSVEDTVNYIQNYILQNSKRGSGLLAKSIGYDTVGSGKDVFIGIGKISALPKYWQIINDGGFTTAAAEGWTITGGFDGDTPPDPNSKGTGVGSGRWNTNGMFGMKPTMEIWGKHYIQAGENFLRVQLQTSIRAVLAQVTQKAGGSVFSGRAHGWGRGSGGAK